MSAADFDEQDYLRSNPDVAAAVAAGSIPSGWAHFVRFGLSEGRPGVADSARRAAAALAAAKVPSPPGRLMGRVHGSDNASTFDSVGRTVALDLNRAAGQSRPSRILDFGCGCGRVTRFLPVLYPDARIFGTDIDAEAIAWDSQSCPAIAFSVNGDRPPLPFEDGSFDLVLAVSVFTHLPEDLQLEWLGELRRVAGRSGSLVLTFASEDLIRPHLGPEQARQLDQAGFFHGAYGETSGLPAYYQSSWHSFAYIKRVWGRYFEILGHGPKGINMHQDWVLCRPKTG
ncbi:MAG TPA: class I SAM-dependent methyltransferase [Opitutaceae bacterium]|jgi:SAM-dependent methyltransferase